MRKWKHVRQEAERATSRRTALLRCSSMVLETLMRAEYLVGTFWLSHRDAMRLKSLGATVDLSVSANSWLQNWAELPINLCLAALELLKDIKESDWAAITKYQGLNDWKYGKLFSYVSGSREVQDPSSGVLVSEEAFLPSFQMAHLCCLHMASPWYKHSGFIRH